MDGGSGDGNGQAEMSKVNGDGGRDWGGGGGQ